MRAGREWGALGCWPVAPSPRRAPLTRWGRRPLAAAQIGFNVETVEYKNISFTVWDVGGQDKVWAAALQLRLQLRLQR